MKSIINSVALMIVALVWQSCDKIEAPYKEPVAVVTGPRKVLVEDYTGHKCGNCPRASRAIYDLKSVYGDNLIIMAIHAGGYASPFPAGAPYYTYDFRTPVGTELDTDFGISLAGNPNGMVNRRQVNGSYILTPSKWASEVAAVLTNPDPLPVKISITNNFNSSSRELQTEIQSEFFSTLTGSYKLVAFLVEDSIVNWQKDYDVTPQDVEFYVHREVFRASMNSTYGEPVTGTTEGSIKTMNYTYTLPVEWNESQVSVISYLFDDATKEIIQVEQKHLE